MKMSLESRRLITRILRREFDKRGILNLMYLGDGIRLVNLASELGLRELATDMIDDLNCEWKNCA